MFSSRFEFTKTFKALLKPLFPGYYLFFLHFGGKHAGNRKSWGQNTQWRVCPRFFAKNHELRWAQRSLQKKPNQLNKTKKNLKIKSQIILTSFLKKWRKWPRQFETDIKIKQISGLENRSCKKQICFWRVSEHNQEKYPNQGGDRLEEEHAVLPKILLQHSLSIFHLWNCGVFPLNKKNAQTIYN